MQLFLSYVTKRADNTRYMRLLQMRGIMDRSGLGAATPYPVPGLESPKVLVMTRLFGHKVSVCGCDLQKHRGRL
jgi:hypothetical protein